MKMIHDLAADAYRAARDRDRAAMDAVLAELADRPWCEVAVAAQLWMDRTMIVMGRGMYDQARLRVEVVADSSGTGIAQPLRHVRQPDIMWVGDLFTAHARHDRVSWGRLWAAVPAEQTHAYTYRLVSTMALTALSYEEAGDSIPAGDSVVSRIVAADRATAGERIARAHLN